MLTLQCTFTGQVQNTLATVGIFAVLKIYRGTKISLFIKYLCYSTRLPTNGEVPGTAEY